MAKRPISLSIIGWYLVVVSVLGVFGMLMMKSSPIAMRMYAQSPLPISAHIAFGIVGSLISAVCGYGILKGLNWSRFLYVGWGLIGFAFSTLTLPVTSIIVLGVAFFAVIVFFLFRPTANEWFKGAAAVAG